MDKCERLSALLAEFEADGNENAAEGIRTAMEHAGCAPQTDSGGTGHPPDPPPGP